MEGSLRRIQLDYIDLYFIHRFDPNPNTAIEETMKALHDLVQMGKIRYLGASAMFLGQFVQMQHVAEQHGWTKFNVMQNHVNAIYREEEREMIPYCIATGVAACHTRRWRLDIYAGNLAIAIKNPLVPSLIPRKTSSITKMGTQPSLKTC